MLIAEIARHQPQVVAQLAEEAEQDAGGNDLQGAAGQDQAGAHGCSTGRKRKAGSDEQKNDELLSNPTDSGLTERQHSIDEACTGGDEDQGEVGVARNHTEESGSRCAQRHQDHGKELGIVNVLLGAEADGEGAASGDEAGARVAQQEAQSQAYGDGKDKDEISAKR